MAVLSSQSAILQNYKGTTRFPNYMVLSEMAKVIDKLLVELN